jgi:hypothetical protein
VARGRRETILSRGNHASRSAAGTRPCRRGRVGLCLASVAPPRRQGGEGRVPRLYALTAWAGGQAPQEESVRQDQKIGCWDQRWGGRAERIKE